MAKVIVERPRFGGGIRVSRACRRAARREAMRDPELAPTCQGMRRPYSERMRCKDFGEHLAPLRRFLLSHAGRPWNDVYSEISEKLRGNGVIQRHVIQHLFDFVAVDVRMVDGRPHKISRWDGVRELSFSKYDELYVEPETGILRALPRCSRKKKRNDFWKTARAAMPVGLKSSIGIDVQFWRIDGAWHRVRLREFASAGIAAEFRLGRRNWQAWCDAIRRPWWGWWDPDGATAFRRDFADFERVRREEIVTAFGTCRIPLGAPQKVEIGEVFAWLHRERRQGARVEFRRLDGWTGDYRTGEIA